MSTTTKAENRKGQPAPSPSNRKARKERESWAEMKAENAKYQRMVDASGLPPLLYGIWEGERLVSINSLSDPRAGVCHGFNEHERRLKAAPFDPHSDLAENCPVAENSIPEGWKLGDELAMRKKLPHSKDTPERLVTFEKAQAVAESTWSAAQEARLQYLLAECERIKAECEAAGAE